MFKDVQKLVLNDDEDYGEEAFEEFLPDAVKPIIAAYRREVAS